MKERMCQYGNCEETKVALTINRMGERNAFCCDEHALWWLMKYVPESSRKPEVKP